MDTEIRAPATLKSDMPPSIGRWFKRVGDAVSLNEPVVEINTDNVTVQVRASTAGVISVIVAADGASINPGAVLGIITVY